MRVGFQLARADAFGALRGPDHPEPWPGWRGSRTAYLAFAPELPSHGGFGNAGPGVRSGVGAPPAALTSMPLSTDTAVQSARAFVLRQPWAPAIDPDSGVINPVWVEGDDVLISFRDADPAPPRIPNGCLVRVPWGEGEPVLVPLE